MALTSQKQPHFLTCCLIQLNCALEVRSLGFRTRTLGLYAAPTILLACRSHKVRTVARSRGPLPSPDCPHLLVLNPSSPALLDVFNRRLSGPWGCEGHLVQPGPRLSFFLSFPTQKGHQRCLLSTLVHQGFRQFLAVESFLHNMHLPFHHHLPPRPYAEGLPFLDLTFSNLFLTCPQDPRTEQALCNMSKAQMDWPKIFCLLPFELN